MLLLELNRWCRVGCWWLVPGGRRQGTNAASQLNAARLLLLLLSIHSTVVSVPVPILRLLGLQVCVVGLTGVATASKWRRSEAPAAVAAPSHTEALLLWLERLGRLHPIAILRGSELRLRPAILLLLCSA